MGTYGDLPAELVTERLRLRAWVPSDAEGYHGLWLERDPRVPSARRVDDEGRPTVEDLRGRLVEDPRGAEPGLGLFPVELRDTGEFIGYCGLIVGQASFDEPEIAYELARRAHGHGYATEAARAVLEAAVRTGRRRLWATVREWNAPSFRVLEKLGFHPSGRVTEDAEHGDSIWMTRALDQR
ncbi:GNAT family N-acetyltransferase [Nonomuraea sp. NPDC049725]|uniref:GNAT family N-acetyltransferase n=1 Tax=Nonomuraea sp. NPDC049725 TaxID=3154508 RepID=UPI00343DC44D